MPLAPPAPRRARRTAPAAAAAALLAGLASPAQSQIAPFALEVRGGLAVPVAGFRDGPVPRGGLERAPAFGASFVTRNVHGWGMAVGFGQRRFDCAGEACPGAAEYLATDVEVGGVRSFGSGRVVPWLRAGVAVGRTEYDAAVPGGVERRLSDLALGASAGAGVAVRVGGRWGVSPGVRYGWTNARAPGEGLLRMRYLVADLGLLLTF